MTERAKRVEFADVNVKGSLCLTVMYMAILIYRKTTKWIQLKLDPKNVILPSRASVPF